MRFEGKNFRCKTVDVFQSKMDLNPRHLILIKGFGNVSAFSRGSLLIFAQNYFTKFTSLFCWFLIKLKIDEIGFFYFLRIISTVFFYRHIAFTGCNELHIVLRIFYCIFFTYLLVSISLGIVSLLSVGIDISS